jgi:porphobilinogen synthase
MVRETSVDPSDLVLPLFVCAGENVRREIASMPGVFHLSVDQLVPVAREALDLGVPAVLLFGLPEHKDEIGSEAWSDSAPVQQAVRTLKRDAPDLVVITDVCLCEYTSHGHCGVLDRGTVVNDATLPLLARTALSHVEAGADIVAPSDMMDFRVAEIRAALDTAGHESVPILAYSAKYASAFYGPFRDAANNAPTEGDRRAYQMDPGNRREALREVMQDIEEGADMVMVKPALAYLDIIRDVREATGLPLVAYNISGEYSMIKAAAANGWIDEKRAVLETLTSIKRAGADLIITYHALDAARWLRAPVREHS